LNALCYNIYPAAGRGVIVLAKTRGSGLRFASASRCQSKRHTTSDANSRRWRLGTVLRLTAKA
jgi:hypothetical protein